MSKSPAATLRYDGNGVSSDSTTTPSVSPEPEATRRAARFGLINMRLLQAAALLFLVPNAIFAASIGGLPAAILAIGCVASVLFIWRTSLRGADSLLAAPVSGRTLVICFAIAMALCLLGGETHLFYANYDWLIRDAVLGDLVGHGFPVFYHFDEQDYVMRAPLGMYMTPALVGRFLGLSAAHLVLLAQNSIATAIIFYFVAQLAKTRKIVVLAILMAFSGMDIVPVLGKTVATFIRTGDLSPFQELEWWTPLFQYSSHVTQLFWTPNHALPGWWFAVLTLLCARREIDISLLVISFAMLMFWSPLAMMGAAPFLVYFGLSLTSRDMFSPRLALAAVTALCFLPVAALLATDAGAVPHHWMIGVEGFLAIYFIFLAVEIPHSAIIVAAWDKVEKMDRRILALAIALLMAIPFYSIGAFNDFAMRASIVPLFLLAFAFARVATLVPRDNGAFATCISVVVIISAATPIVELKRSFAGSYAISTCNLATAVQRWDPKTTGPNYFARLETAPIWLQPTGSDRIHVENRKCWPDQPLLDERHK
jgi:hypothetical protein